MTIVIEGLSERASSRAFIARKIRAAFEREQPISARVGLTDENGPKGGAAIRCGINVDRKRA